MAIPDPYCTRRPGIRMILGPPRTIVPRVFQRFVSLHFPYSICKSRALLDSWFERVPRQMVPSKNEYTILASHALHALKSFLLCFTVFLWVAAHARLTTIKSVRFSKWRNVHIFGDCRYGEHLSNTRSL